MKKTLSVLVLATVALWAATARPMALQLTSGDTALLFGGTDAEGGIGDWYVSNGVVQAIIDNVGKAQDLVPLLGASAPPIQSEINLTGGTIIDLGRVGQDDDQLTQMFTVGGLSTSNFFLYDTISAPSSNTIRVSGTILFPPTSTRQNPCLTVVTDYTAAGSDPFLTVTSTATNGCGANLANFGGFLDVFIWTLRGLIPFSGGGAPPPGGKGFNHPVLNLANPLLAVELPTFMAAPGLVVPADGIMDTANNTTSGEVSYGLLGVEVAVDPDGPGGSAPTVTPVDSLFGVSSTLVTALGNFPVSDGTPAGGQQRPQPGTHRRVRRVQRGRPPAGGLRAAGLLGRARRRRGEPGRRGQREHRGLDPAAQRAGDGGVHRPREDEGDAAHPGEAHLQGREPDPRSGLPQGSLGDTRRAGHPARDFWRDPVRDDGRRGGTGECRLHRERLGWHPAAPRHLRCLRLARHGVQRRPQTDPGGERGRSDGRFRAQAGRADPERRLGRLPRPLRPQPGPS